MTNIPSYPGEAGSATNLPSGPAAPPSVMNAVRLMYLGAILSAIGLVLGLATASGLRATIHKANPKLTPSQLTTAVHVIVASGIVAGLIGVGVWIWMAVANRRGRNWARITGTVFFGLDTLTLILAFTRTSGTANVVAAIVIWAAGLGAVYFLWQRDSSAYFAAPRYVQ